MYKELLLEIGTEEIPARFLPPAQEQMREGMVRLLEDFRIACEGIAAYATPRRLALYGSIAERQVERTETVLGPPRSAAFTPEGEPTKAALGFARAKGVRVEDLRILESGGKEYVGVQIRDEGAETRQLLPEILPRFIASMSFPKNMRWMDRDLRFVRPIHWILALFGGEVVPFTLHGIKSGQYSRGHRFMSPGVFLVQDFASYREQTERNFILIDPEERRRRIREDAEALAKERGGRVLDDPELLETVADLVEHPFPLLGTFDRAYLALPREVLLSAMREHQKYFSLVDASGSLIPFFIAVSNTRAEDPEIVRAGNERVLRARLADARFFYEEDLRVPLRDRVERLKAVTYQEKLGTVYDKVQRVIAVSRSVAGRCCPDAGEAASRAAFLCKADLLTGMVGEFPKLQGMMGREYALRSGEPPAVAQAIHEHYLPRFAGDALPASDPGRVVGLAEKLDNLTGCFAVGLIPTGSEDPYALRRQAAGILQILWEAGWRVSLSALVADAVEALSSQRPLVHAQLRGEVGEFLRQRMGSLLENEGFRYDLVEAALAVHADDPVAARRWVEALATLREGEGFAPLAIAFRRVINIVPDGFQGEVDPERFMEPAERQLYQAWQAQESAIREAVRAGDYLNALTLVAALRPPVDAFFEQVLVMDKDSALRDNRLALLKGLGGLFLSLADFTKMVVE